MKHAIFITLMMFAILSAYSLAAPIHIIEPYNATVSNGGSVYLGKVGPGQSFYLTIQSYTENASGTRIIKGWNKLIVSNLPSEWVASNSTLYGTYLSVLLAPSPNTLPSIYSFNLTAINIGNYSKIGNTTFTAYVNVTPNVFYINATPSVSSSPPGVPVDLNVTINNFGLSDSPFYISVIGLPAWNEGSKEVIALHGKTGTFTYPIYENEPGNYKAKLLVSSEASPMINKTINLTLSVKSTLKGDINALQYGSVIFPIMYEPVYAILYILLSLFQMF
ncbi:MAG: hypothetical protein QXD11_02930 [Candidatus Micrarchaeaceae archaeon]